MQVRIRKAASRILNQQAKRIVVSRPARSNTEFWRRVIGGLACVALILAVGIGVGWSNWLEIKDRPAQPAAKRIERWQNSPLDGSVPIVKEYLRRTAHDPDAMEFEQWSPVYNSPQGHHEVRVEVRGKNMAGAKILKRYTVKYNEQSVLSVDPPE